MKKLLLGAVVALLPLTGFSATILGFQVGGGTWEHDPSGSVSATTDGVGVSADLKSNMNLSEEKEGYSYFILEHPVPLIPNIKVVNTKLTSQGTGTTTFTFNTNSYPVGATTKLDLSQTDYILYYEILDNVVSLDLGLNAKMIDGQININSNITNISGTIPMLYVAAEIMLPAGFAINADISYTKIGDVDISDTTAKLTYTTDFMLGVEAGIRTQSYTGEVDTFKANMEFSGMFAGVYFKF